MEGDGRFEALLLEAHRRLQLELALHHAAQKVLVDARLEAVDDLRVLVGEVLAALDAESLVKRRVGGVVALEEALVVLEHMHLERMEKVAEKVDSWGRENEKLKGQW